MILSKYSMGIGDRFARQGQAQLRALIEAKALGVDIVPVWNKSNREHLIAHTHPDSVRAEADAAVKALGWKGPYHVDADHIGLKTVDNFIKGSDFFTLDVADFTGQPAPEAEVQAFVTRYGKYAPTLKIPGIDRALNISTQDIADIARKYLLAVKEAGAIYRHVEAAKGKDTFITEVSIDETDKPQTPVELFFILAAVADQRIPAQTIAPKFTGRFNKGVDYVGDVVQFEKEFNEDLCVIAFAIKEFGLPANLKLSVHSGSDKFFDLRADQPRHPEAQRRVAPQDGRDDVAGRGRGTRAVGRGRAKDGAGDLRKGVRAGGRALQALRRGD